MLSGGFVATAFVLHGAGVALIWAVQPLRYSRSFALRQAVLHVARPGNQTRVILLAVGLGSFFILGVRSLQANLLRDFAVQIGPTAPDMFLIDIQPDQREALGAFLDAQNGDAPPPNTIPVLRARVVGVKGRDDDARQLRAGARAQRAVARVHRHLSAGARAQREGDRRARGGTPARRPREAEVSIEEGFLRTTRLNVGDQMTFDVLGRIVTARVASIRRVDWQDFRAGGFMFVFRPGVVRRRAAHLHLVVQGAGRRRRAGAHAGRPRGAVPERLGDRPARDPADGSGIVNNVTHGGHRGGRAGAAERRADPGRRGVDDEVPPRLRGGDPEDARAPAAG